jgi:hypothetical protein
LICASSASGWSSLYCAKAFSAASFTFGVLLVGVVGSEKREGGRVVPHQHAAVQLDPTGYTFCYCYLKGGRPEPSGVESSKEL